MEEGPTRGSRGGKGPRARLCNALQQIVVDQYKQQGRRFCWVKFPDAAKHLFTWQETLNHWSLWYFSQTPITASALSLS